MTMSYTSLKYHCIQLTDSIPWLKQYEDRGCKINNCFIRDIISSLFPDEIAYEIQVQQGDTVFVKRTIIECNKLSIYAPRHPCPVLIYDESKFNACMFRINNELNIIDGILDLINDAFETRFNYSKQLDQHLILSTNGKPHFISSMFKIPKAKYHDAIALCKTITGLDNIDMGIKNNDYELFCDAKANREINPKQQKSTSKNKKSKSKKKNSDKYRTCRDRHQKLNKFYIKYILATRVIHSLKWYKMYLHFCKLSLLTDNKTSDDLCCYNDIINNYIIYDTNCKPFDEMYKFPYIISSNINRVVDTNAIVSNSNNVKDKYVITEGLCVARDGTKWNLFPLNMDNSLVDPYICDDMKDNAKHIELPLYTNGYDWIIRFDTALIEKINELEHSQ